MPTRSPRTVPPPRPAARLLDAAPPSPPPVAIPEIVEVADVVPEVAVTRTKPGPVTVRSTDVPEVPDTLPGPSTDHRIVGFETTFPYASLAVAVSVMEDPTARPPAPGDTEIAATAAGVTVSTEESGAARAEAAVIVAVRASVS